MNLEPSAVGHDVDGRPIFLDWRNRALHVTGGIDVGKSLFIRSLIDGFDGCADILGYAGLMRDTETYPEFFHFGELDAFHNALISQARRRMEGDTERPLVVIADKWSGTKGIVLDDILRAVRHGEAWNMYAILEDRNRAAGPFHHEFRSLPRTKVTMVRGEGIIEYSKTSNLVKFKR